MMNDARGRILEYCKYYEDGNCPHKVAYAKMVDEITSRGQDIGGLQPRCPRDAQKTKRGVYACICERRERL